MPRCLTEPPSQGGLQTVAASRQILAVTADPLLFGKSPMMVEAHLHCVRGMSVFLNLIFQFIGIPPNQAVPKLSSPWDQPGIFTNHQHQALTHPRHSEMQPRCQEFFSLPRGGSTVQPSLGAPLADPNRPHLGDE